MRSLIHCTFRASNKGGFFPPKFSRRIVVNDEPPAREWPSENQSGWLIAVN